MHKIKQQPEDFIVKEVSNVDVNGTGEYNYFTLKKENYGTLRAVETIAKSLRIPVKFIGFAGNKDKVAVTEQVVSVKSRSRKEVERLKLKDIKLVYLGEGKKPVSLGDLLGNEFVITVRNLTNKELRSFEEKVGKKLLVPNYFGEQRFSDNNQVIGKCIVKKDFKKAVELILESNSDYKREINDILKKNKNDFVGALRAVNKKLLKLYVHAYQSFIWNETVEKYIKKNGLKDVKIPIIGFGTEINDKEIESIVSNIMEREELTSRDFIIRELPELSVEGKERNMVVKPDNFEVNNKGKDKLNKGKSKVVLSFRLPKGCYATIVIEWLFNS
ncbi:MAG: tRNA pseudouridine(13) synthase TruD [Candidatus Woesearchaeota archaeon]|jgi:tRNA pseudouridine13 synthase|nr:tRNA pseudouridine(13) synthase TruD [Candidatus Woesearchaeota archaeon]